MDTLYVTQASGNCIKPFIAASYSDYDLDIIEVNLLAGQHRCEAYLNINHRGQVPFLVTADGTGIAESNAMLWLIGAGTDLMPANALEQARSLQWMFFEQSKLEPMISPARFLTFVAPEAGKGREADIAAWITKAKDGLGVLNAHLSNSSFMLGERYGITDIALFGYVHVSGEAGIDMEQFPAVQNWIERVSNTPRFRPLSELCSGASPFAESVT